MEYASLGKTEMKISRLCLGTMSYGSQQWRAWALEEQEARPFIKHVLEAGINFFDTANVYSTGESERITGKLLGDQTAGRAVQAPSRFRPFIGRLVAECWSSLQNHAVKLHYE